MTLKIALDSVVIHETPLEEIHFDTNTIAVTFDDADEKRWKLTFKPYQAIQTTTIDCYPFSNLVIDEAIDENGYFQRYLLEVTDSQWIKALQDELRLIDPHATFLEKAHHYIFPFQDIVVEIIAWGYQLEEVY
ncbi:MULTISPECIES: hypothetical protein [Brevibacillus]|jgi:hypothetical protein|uniref:Uncharacterized protein n=2 Tax=Brevibacillus parabrevis TaxID=54914 RepID=A0A4Y3PVT1_BREPA|nr:MULTISPECIES: hypothetical protein [Brevibacillus]MDH6353264.1 hypothetical protein [Brevibacillus sp. 1238]RNB92731.1 hypothetical protein EDM60_25370 [Brevibacillus parabrevis]WDV92942.1 hypothetical protein PSE45_14815 [Brevibacillus parabrevis]GEB35399.1 hypothetical protein BPA01_49790 [Brevibacillus parabrevis]